MKAVTKTASHSVRIANLFIRKTITGYMTNKIINIFVKHVKKICLMFLMILFVETIEGLSE